MYFLNQNRAMFFFWIRKYIHPKADVLQHIVSETNFRVLQLDITSRVKYLFYICIKLQSSSALLKNAK